MVPVTFSTFRPGGTALSPSFPGQILSPPERTAPSNPGLPLTTKDKAATLIEALPYLQRFRGKTLLIKIGGSAMDNPDLVSSLMRDIVFLEVAGINPVLVHGGGKAISSAMEAAGLVSEMNTNGTREVLVPKR